MYSQKKKNRIIQRLKRDNDLGTPFHKTNKIDAQRETFLQSLISSETFGPTNKFNDAKFAESTRDTLKRFKLFDYSIIALFVICGAGLTPVATHGLVQNNKTLNTHKDLSLTAFATLGALMGFFLGFFVSVALQQESRDNAIESTYNRLSVRLFDLMRENNPDLDEKILKSCNPEMARVIHTLLVANMSEQDVKEINAIAMKLAPRLRNITPTTKPSILINCDNEIKDALNIIEQTLILNPQLNDAIMAVYRGKIPTIFRLEKTR